MAKTKAQSTQNNPLIDQIIAFISIDYPDLILSHGKKYSYRPPNKIYIGPPEENDHLLLLHEIGHALCRHTNYTTHIERLKIESQAWDKAKELAEKYSISFDLEFAEIQLDTYRDWLHQKSICKKCGLTRYQTKDGEYHCPHCESFL